MNEKDIKEKMKAFLSNHTLAVISTIHTNDTSPESAVVAFAENDALELVFGTSNATRKYKNILTNPHVSFVIGWSSERGTMQYEGTARESDPEESAACSSMLVKKNPASEKFVVRDDQRYFIVTPT